MPRFHLCIGLAPTALLAACSSSVPTTATVTTIDRSCTIIETSFTRGPDGEKLEGTQEEVRRYKVDCNEIDDLDEVKRKRSKSVDGTADINFVYTGPHGKQHNGTLTFTGRDGEFYDLKAGEPLRIPRGQERSEERLRRLGSLPSRSSSTAGCGKRSRRSSRRC